MAAANLAAASQLTQDFILGGLYATLGNLNYTVSINYTWRSYIQVSDYQDTNGDGVIDAGDLEPGQTLEDLVLETKWVEVVGVLDPYDAERGSFYIEGAGYTDWWSAYYGAVIAARYYPNNVPDEYMDQAVPVDAWGDEFRTITDWLSDHVVHIDADLIAFIEFLIQHGFLIPAG
jgi:hypothetical protein